MNSIVLMGAHIGDNVIIGAGSVVSGNIESDSVYAGNPARKVCSLDAFYEKLKSDFINSAKIYASKVNSGNEMGLYRCLIDSDSEFDEFIDNRSFNGINKSCLKAAKRRAERISFEELKS
ncbi:MAG: hypothetical protein LUG66_09595 [Clostridiales bacterium]|nr:hypothetical protein [Clostridiales bacterium]